MACEHLPDAPGKCPECAAAAVRRVFPRAPATDPTRLARTTDPETSHEAARTVSTEALKGRLLGLITLQPGLTRGHYEEISGIAGYALSKRLSDLVGDGLVVYEGTLESPVSGRQQSRCWPVEGTT